MSYVYNRSTVRASYDSSTCIKYESVFNTTGATFEGNTEGHGTDPGARGGGGARGQVPPLDL